MFNKKNVKNIYALTPIQESILFYALYDRESLAYFEQAFYHITGDVNISRFEEAWNVLIQRHDILRTLFVHKNVPQPLQIVLKKRPLELHFEDIRTLSKEAQDAYCQQYQDTDKHTPFDLSQDVLMRLAVFQLEEQSFNVFWSIHHILLDGWSVGIIHDELYTIYHALLEGKQPVLKPVTPFSRYVTWLNKQDKAAAKQYWRDYLMDYHQLSTLPHLAPQAGMAPRQAFTPKKVQFALSETLTSAIQQLASANQVTLNTVIQSLWGILLSSYNDRNDVVFAATVSGRPAEIKGIENMVGLFINTIPVRITIAPQETLPALLQKIQQESTAGQNYHYSSLEEIQSETTLKRNLFDHILIFENYPDLTNTQEQAKSQFVIDRFEQFELTSFDLSVQLFPSQCLKVIIIYNPLVYDKATITHLETHLTAIIAQVLDNEAVIVSDIKVLSAEEQAVYVPATQILPVSLTDERRKISTAYAQPENERQQQLVALWKEILAPDSLGIDDNFFEVGGHSLIATRIVSQIHKLLNVEVSLQEFFDNPNIRRLDKLMTQKQTSQYEEIPALPEQPHYAVSHAQQRLWVLDKLETDFVAYNQSMGFRFEGDLNVKVLNNAFHKVLERHESLRTTFITVAGEPRQKVHPVSVITEQLSVFSEPVATIQGDALAVQIAKQEANRPFDLETGPLVRVKLLQLAEQRYLLLLNMHHIICDGWSFGVFENEILTLYQFLLADKEAFLEPLKIQYRDYAAWQNAQLDGDTIKPAQAYWHQKLGGELPVLNLPTDYPRPIVQSYQGNTYAHLLEADLITQLDEFCRQNEVSRFMLLLAAIKVLLYRYTAQEDIIIGSPIAGRNHPDLENQIGFYVNTLALRDTITRDEPFKAFLLNVKQTTIEAYTHQLYPFDQLVEKLAVQRDVSHSPIFDVMLALQDNAPTVAEPDNLKISAFEYETGIGQFDITFNVIATDKVPGGLQINVTYNTALFQASTIKRLAKHLEVLLHEILTDANQPIKAFNILSATERQQLLNDFNQTQTDYPSDKTIIALFEEQVDKTPDNVAVMFADQQLSYRELNTLANSLAYHLNAHYHIQPEDIISVLLEQSEWVIISLLGILKLGGTYLPIDPGYPPRRIAFMIQESACKVLLTKAEYQQIARETGAKHLVDVEEVATLSQDKTVHLSSEMTQNNLAYMIYTSGSTGEPKGVMVEHGGFVNMCLAQIAGFGVSASDRVLQFSSPSFDASLSEIFMALLCGAVSVPLNRNSTKETEQFLSYLEQYQVNVVTFPPVYLHVLNKHPLPSLKTIITAGEGAILEDARFYSQTKRYFNAYGPTESSVCATYHEVKPSENQPYTGRVSIGKPIANTAIFILDDALNLVPIGVTGELCLSGAGLARGYWQKPQLTETQFIEHPFAPGKRLYKTGDLARWLTDGNLEFLGRKDEQVKVRGYRIELGEIRSCLLQYPTIQEALALTVSNPEGHSELVAYIIVEAGTQFQASEVREHLAKLLPTFMLPSYFVLVKSFPLTLNGKIDQKALPNPFLGTNLTLNRKHIAPRNATETKLVAAWQKLLHQQNIGIYDNYFAVGGDSIKAIQLVSHLQQAGLKLKASDIFQYPTIVQLSKVITKTERIAPQQSVTGLVPLTAITRWFFQAFPVDKHHFNHAELFYSKTRLDEEALQAVFTKLQAHHDALRMRYQFEDENGQVTHIIQENGGLDEPVSFQTVDLTADEQALMTLDAHINTLQASLELKKCPLMKAALYHLHDGDRLLILIHHLVVDGVSWRILLEDIVNGYEQYRTEQVIALPLKTDSFQSWAEQVQIYSRCEALLAEKDYWHCIETTQIQLLPEDYETGIKGCMRDVARLNFTLSASETLTLLTEARTVYNAGVDAMLLTALAYAMTQWHGQADTLITLEGHGREAILEGIDISRTVGWFTSTYPVILTSKPTADVRTQIDTTKTILGRIPNRGMGYSILKYVTPAELKTDLVFNLNPAINFNYLGQFDSDKMGNLETAPESCGNLVSPNAQMIHDIDIYSVVWKGQLFLEMAFNGKRFKAQRMEKLLANCEDKLKDIVASIRKM